MTTTPIAEFSPALEILLATGACFSAIVGLALRTLDRRSTLEIASGVRDKSTAWLGAALGLLLLLLLIPFIR